MRKLNERFFNSSRGRIVSLLRQEPKTVNELAEALGMTDNGVRSHLLSLERDGLVKQGGFQRAMRKPPTEYVLTAAAEELFPKPYDAVLNALIAVLKEEMSKGRLETILREVGQAVAASARARGDLESRVGNAVRVLRSLGGAPRLENENGHLFIRSKACPLAAIVSEHPEVCALAEELVSQIVGVPVQEHCMHQGSPSCCFAIQDDSKRQESSERET